MTGKAVSIAEWQEARAELLKKEKAATHMLDDLSTSRRSLPMIHIDAERFKFDTPDGERSLFDLFAGRKQLILYHFMLKAEDKEGCVGCSFLMDHIPDLRHMWSRDTSFVAVAPASVQQIEAYKQRMDWKFPFYSSGKTFKAVDEAGEEVSWKPGNGYFGISVFLREGDDVFHTYSTTDRVTTITSVLVEIPRDVFEIKHWAFDNDPDDGPSLKPCWPKALCSGRYAKLSPDKVKSGKKKPTENPDPSFDLAFGEGIVGILDEIAAENEAKDRKKNKGDYDSGDYIPLRKVKGRNTETMELPIDGHAYPMPSIRTAEGFQPSPTSRSIVRRAVRHDLPQATSARTNAENQHCHSLRVALFDGSEVIFDALYVILPWS